jgi:hypothetical protein
MFCCWGALLHLLDPELKCKLNRNLLWEPRTCWAFHINQSLQTCCKHGQQMSAGRERWSVMPLRIERTRLMNDCCTVTACKPTTTNHTQHCTQHQSQHEFQQQTAATLATHRTHLCQPQLCTIVSSNACKTTTTRIQAMHTSNTQSTASPTAR